MTSDLSEIEQRLRFALSRLDAGLRTRDDILSTAQSPALQASEPEETADLEQKVANLTAQLEKERTENKALETRVQRLKDRQDGKLTALEQAVVVGRARFARFDSTLQQLRQANAELRDINNKLRAAAESGVSEPELINSAMKAELEALNANRAADVAEMDAILEELTPIIEQEVKDATG